MHPKIRLRRRRCIPSRVLSIEKVDIPGRATFDIQKPRISFTERLTRIPVVANAGIGYERRAVADVRRTRSQLGNPDEERCEVFRRDSRENVVLDFERPSKTEGSSRANEHDDTHTTGGTVESGSQRFAVVA
jgi:hypothetical protein